MSHLDIEKDRKYLLGCDVDNTLVPTMMQPDALRLTGYVALQVLHQAVDQSSQIVDFGSVTGRTFESQQAYAREVPALGEALGSMSFTITAVGTAIHRRKGREFLQESAWPALEAAWSPSAVHHAMDSLPEAKLQEPEAQTVHKVSYDVSGVADRSHARFVSKVSRRLHHHGLRAEVVFSGGQYLDLLPTGVHKGTALLHAAALAAEPGQPRPGIIAAGDSMNDKEMLRVADLAILPANADKSLRGWARRTIPHKTYFADEPFATGILEGLAYNNIL